ncbi:heme exporter protein CcmD [Sphingomonas sp. RP10(2022)]|uniref:Heme exporter protein D n=1 Tax=Sphingomonas liriopis TaxID=2949094 RepID=A0A9X2HVU9_9SPHN|nr:heme exporter protein CcmD [Sphingomonas liriopis]MCP3734478.1 heme exporter protein CcmD [Sphingomonas liriopis]
MNHWPFILAAYGVTLAAAAALTMASYIAMKRAEK